MIQVYSGPTGSGKSYHAVDTIIKHLRKGLNVIADFPIELKGLKNIKGEFTYCPLLTIQFLVSYAELHHDMSSMVENQTLVVIDEVYNYFDPRDFARDDRMLWVSFLKISRHYCLSFLFVCQNAKTDLDKKILMLLDYNISHKDIAKLQFGFQIIVLFTGKWFLANKWSCSCGQSRTKIDSKWIHLNKRFAKRYNSHHIFDNSAFMRELKRYEKIHKGDDEYVEQQCKSDRAAAEQLISSSSACRGVGGEQLISSEGGNGGGE